MLGEILGSGSAITIAADALPTGEAAQPGSVPRSAGAGRLAPSVVPGVRGQRGGAGLAALQPRSRASAGRLSAAREVHDRRNRARRVRAWARDARWSSPPTSTTAGTISRGTPRSCPLSTKPWTTWRARGPARSEYAVGEVPAGVPAQPGFAQVANRPGADAGWVAVNVDPGELDPTRMSEAEVRGGHHTVAGGGAARGPDAATGSGKSASTSGNTFWR